MLLSAFLSHNLSGRREKRRSRSLVATCLESLYVQSPAIEFYFSLLSGLSEGASWTQATLPVLFGYSDRTKPFDVPFDRVRDNILNLNLDLADMILVLELRVRQINGFLKEDTQFFSNQSKTNHDEILRNLESNRRSNVAIAEYVGLVASMSKSVRKQLFENTKKIVVNWSSVEAKAREIDMIFLEEAGIQRE